jgi:hypothetical protein
MEAHAIHAWEESLSTIAENARFIIVTVWDFFVQIAEM